MSKGKTSDNTAQQPLTTAANGGSGGTALVASTLDELAALEGVEGVDFSEDGLGQVDASDIKIAAKVFNFKGVNAQGRKIPEDVFYDTVDETVKEHLDA